MPAVVFVLAVLFFGGVVALILWAIQQADREQAHGLALRNAPRDYNQAAPQITSWLPQCRIILREEGRKGTAYGEGSACVRARAKSLELIENALRPATVLYHDDIDTNTYQATQRLEALRNACLNCAEANKGKRYPRCLALTQSLDVEGDLIFQE